MTITEADYEDLHWELIAEKGNSFALGEALKKLQKAAEELIAHRDEPVMDELQGWITDLEEAIPCESCLGAPCVCPD